MVTPEDIPAELIAILDARAGRVHSRTGGVVSSLAEILTSYDSLRERARLDSARLAGTPGDVLGGLDSASVEAGRLAGRVETLEWAQTELKLLLERASGDRFADTRAIEEFLVLVQDSLRLVQDGSGTAAGLVRRDLGTQVGVELGGIVPPEDRG